ncbi:DCC1-like thiol-disulfide oxidoreductase family protein [Phytomonospora sp. NPDC050363]|uniref:thiol-disulfide oxidoreductase DCC family protein n=1 Tax=Phytomonospora sp. NPDC050363 TaxID=3155642 RepID=UPI003404B4ED
MTAVFLYDGDCAFCSSCARFVEKRIPTGADVAAWQHRDIAVLGLTEAEVDAAVQWVEVDGAGRPGAPLSGPAAIAALLKDAGGVWRPMGAVLGLRPVLAVVWPLYRWVARNRDKMPGGTAACALPQAQREAARKTE